MSTWPCFICGEEVPLGELFLTSDGDDVCESCGIESDLFDAGICPTCGSPMNDVQECLFCM